MKHLIINVAGLGWETTQRFGLTHLYGCAFKNALSVFPAVTCTAQATLRTATEAREHGMIANGIFLRNLQRPAFWEQSSQLVSGKRIWEEARKNGYTVGMFYFQQSLGEEVDELITPWPIHKHHGGMILKNYSRPLNKKPAGYNENFPLQQYWG
ncbi:MAG: alkaline phosphatase family protein, partial [Kiritimatiellae bacterium]|nr:alkaline phosphatase family protein [Kiritimatiellia bacterium]